MAKPAFAALLAAVMVQYLIAALVYLDARRLGPRDPAQYGAGIIVPVAGFVVVLYYLSERGGLQRAD